MNSKGQSELDPHSAEADSRGDSDRSTSLHRRAARRKVFFLIDSLNVGGTETQAVELATRLSAEHYAERYAVTLGCLRAQGPLLEKVANRAIAILEFYPAGGVDSWRGIYQVLRLARFLRRERFQIVHTHDLYSNLLGIPAAVIARVPVIVSSQRDLGHLELYRTSRRRWLRRLQKLSTSVLTNANAVRESLLDEAHFPARKIRLVYNGVDVTRFICESRDRSWIAPNAGHERWIVLVGSMHSDVKGHRWLIDAAPQVVSEFPHVRFVFVGDGALRKNFESLITRVGLQRHFLFLGERDDVPKILCCCDIAVLPSRAEGLSNALLEFLAAGLPTVATRVGGNAEIVQDGETGLLIPPEDASSLADALLRLLHDPGMGQELGRNGKEFVASHFGFDRMVSETDRLYTELLQSRGME